MCGIIGVISKEQPGHWSSTLDYLVHRGPDGQAEQTLQVRDKSVWLAHTRLAILDLSPAGKQPMKSRDGRWWITFNGEIYNHLELRKMLDCPFRGHSDTETLTELISARGIHKVLPLLNGMYAFAALDTVENKLYLARDPFGIKPLYYIKENDTFAFSSEVKALRQTGLIDNTIDARGIQQYLTLRYVPSPGSLWNGVNKLKPGHLLTIDVSSLDALLTNIVKPVTDFFTGSLEDATQSYYEQLRNAINRQLISDVPVGVLLSGGIDSALVAAMAKDLGHDLPCFTVGFGDTHSECEISDARETARTLGLPISSVTVTPESLLNALPDIVRAVEEPLGTTSIMPMWQLVQRAREDVTVVLTGQGTDEPWGGYRRYQVEMVRRFLPVSQIWRVLQYSGNTLFGKSLPEFIERGLRSLSESNLTSRSVEACTLFSKNERELLSGSSYDGGAEHEIREWFDWLSTVKSSTVEKMMRVDSRMNLADDLLLYGDKISMASSLEARVPMLDIELVKFVESLPISYRIGINKTKIAHKKMAEQFLPHSIVHRKKRGFQVPFGDWSRGVWRSYIEDVLLSPGAPHFDFLDRSSVITMWKEHLHCKPDRSRQMFSLFMLSLWCREIK